MAGYGQVFELSKPSLEGDQSCGSSLMDCQCIRVYTQATRNGFTMDDLAQQAPLSAFGLYRQPNPPAMHSAPNSSGPTAQAIAVATDNNSSSAIASGPTGSML